MLCLVPSHATMVTATKMATISTVAATTATTTRFSSHCEHFSRTLALSCSFSSAVVRLWKVHAHRIATNIFLCTLYVHAIHLQNKRTVQINLVSFYILPARRQTNQTDPLKVFILYRELKYRVYGTMGLRNRLRNILRGHDVTGCLLISLSLMSLCVFGSGILFCHFWTRFFCCFFRNKVARVVRKWKVQ